MLDNAAEMGISESEFFDMTPRQFVARQRRERRQAETIRMQTFLICSYSGNMKRGTRIGRFWPLPWDHENAPVFEKQTPEEALAFRHLAQKVIAQKRLASGNDRRT